MPTDQITLQTILQRGYAAYECHHRLPDDVRRAVWALLVCRTAVLGGHVQACPDGHVERIWDHSCRHRMCPPYAWLQVERWLRRQKARLLACDHDHMICTMPAERHGLWSANVAAMTHLWCETVRETLGELLGDATYLGAQPGIIAALHTVGRWPPVASSWARDLWKCRSRWTGRHTARAAVTTIPNGVPCVVAS